MGQSQVKSPRAFVQSIFETAGIEINGNQPWDIQVHNDNFYGRLVQDGALGFGDAYTAKWWDCKELDTLLTKIFNAKLDHHAAMPFFIKLKYILAKIVNFQTKHRAKEVAYKHYDLGNDLFKNMLDSTMTYSCAYWKEAHDLETAQQAKLRLICEKLYLKPGLRVLDIGCGWGGLAKFAAEHYGVEVVGITISKQQAAYAKTQCAALPISIRLQDYRDLHETFDRVVSVGMFEHVGHLNYATFMRTVHRVLKADGLFLLHTIGGNETTTMANAWLNKYIFPNGHIPSIAQIAQSIEKRFVMEDWHNFGPYYDQTLIAWHANFTKNWRNIAAQYDERFYRMWNFYLLSCAGSFRARMSQLWQIVMSKGEWPGLYVPVR